MGRDGVLLLLLMLLVHMDAQLRTVGGALHTRVRRQQVRVCGDCIGVRWVSRELWRVVHGAPYLRVASVNEGQLR
jgi:hypothetical protein